MIMTMAIQLFCIPMVGQAMTSCVWVEPRNKASDGAFRQV